jgi:hypothetical protein
MNIYNNTFFKICTVSVLIFLSLSLGLVLGNNIKSTSNIMVLHVGFLSSFFFLFHFFFFLIGFHYVAQSGFRLRNLTCQSVEVLELQKCAITPGWSFNYSSIIHWKIYSFSIELVRQACQKSTVLSRNVLLDIIHW